MAISNFKLLPLHKQNIMNTNSFSNYLKKSPIPLIGSHRGIADTIAKNHKETEAHVQQLRTELQGRVGVLEKWRWLIIGGSIVVGFIAQKMIIMP